MSDAALLEVPSELIETKPIEQPVRRSTRYQSLDLWRGLACLAVVVYHATMQVVPIVEPGDSVTSKLGYALVRATGLLWVGVPMFFVISGYCIFATLDKSHARGDSLGTYFFRRFRRIFPPYWAALAPSVVVIVGVEMTCALGLFTGGIFTVNAPGSLSAWQWIGNATLTESWRAHVVGGETRFILPHVWTLCYEEQFYAVAGLILFLAPRRMFAASAVISGIVVVTMVVSRKLGVNLDGTFLDGRWLLFAAGILVFYAVNYATPRVRAGICVALAAALAAQIVVGLPFAIYLDRGIERFTALAFALALIVLHRWDDAIARRRVFVPIAICGTMCYSLYLAHALVTKGIGHAMYYAGMTGAWQTLCIAVPLSLVISAAIGWAFHVAVERRFLNTK